MSFLDSILGLFGKKEEPLPARRPPTGKTATTAQKKLLTKAVYTTREVELPVWSHDLSQTELIEALEKNWVCKFPPHIEKKKIMSTRKGPDGNLETEYDGLAGDCGAIKTFGQGVATQEGLMQPYRYMDLNAMYRFCCDRPKLCPFFNMSEGQTNAMESRQKKL
ncbi:MAG: hypothetical protein KAI66_15675 [Lentisphaeria bacterium]|nr:hypothetical protein [Lentisphaeria bacterium]